MQSDTKAPSPTACSPWAPPRLAAARPWRAWPWVLLCSHVSVCTSDFAFAAGRARFHQRLPLRCLPQRAGSNKNYPNPPGWGLSFHLNGFETPVLRMVRGVPYNFTVMAGETHPLYITDTIIGGGAHGPLARAGLGVSDL